MSAAEIPKGASDASHAAAALTPNSEIEQLAAALDQTGEFRVLRRFHPRQRYAEDDGTPTVRALFVDVETTGLDPHKDAIIEVACVPFDYGKADGRIFTVQPPVSYFEDPGRPIPDQVTALTGITNEDVRGKRMDDEAVARLAGEASLIIAHNARFDRPFLERRLSCFAEKPWACSVNEIPWKRLGCNSSSLEFLLYKSCGEFFDAHRAADDCLAAIHVLATAAPTGELPMRQLLDAARRESYVIRAIGSPIECKDVLKARGYRWKPAGNDGPGAWWIELDSEARDAELAWLSSNAYPSRSPSYRVERRTARDRYRS